MITLPIRHRLATACNVLHCVRVVAAPSRVLGARVTASRRAPPRPDRTDASLVVGNGAVKARATQACKAARVTDVWDGRNWSSNHSVYSGR